MIREGSPLLPKGLFGGYNGLKTGGARVYEQWGVQKPNWGQLHPWLLRNLNISDIRKMKGLYESKSVQTGSSELFSPGFKKQLLLLLGTCDGKGGFIPPASSLQCGMRMAGRRCYPASF